MSTTFTAQLDQFRTRTKEQMKAVLQQSVQDVLEEASRPEALGGRMPVKTGFMRNSLVSELNGSTSWPVTKPGQDGGAPHYLLTIAQMEPGDIARFAWTAAYAARMENGFVGQDSKGRTFNQQGRHFVEAAAAQWPQFVARNIGKLK